VVWWRCWTNVLCWQTFVLWWVPSMDVRRHWHWVYWLCGLGVFKIRLHWYDV